MSNSFPLVAVTGSTGFVGSYVVRDLLNKNYRVLALVRDPSNEEKLKTLKSFDPTGEKLSFAGGDLENVDYETVFNVGVEYVIHIASPFIYTSPDPEKDIINPAVNGTLSVLKAASKINSIKKVVVTSSGLAVVDQTTQKSEFKDDDWANPPISNPYAYSKVKAERAAWEFIKENNETEGTNHFSLVVMNPTFILGPALSPLLNTSVSSVINLLFNKMPVPPVNIGLINVQDVSTAHILAIESDKANNKRITINGSVVLFKEFALSAMKQFPQFKYNSLVTDNVDESVPQPHKYTLRSNRLIDELGFNSTFIPLDVTIKTMIEHLLNSNLIKPELV